jgi:hypothetical protein
VAGMMARDRPRFGDMFRILRNSVRVPFLMNAGLCQECLTSAKFETAPPGVWQQVSLGGMFRARDRERRSSFLDELAELSFYPFDDMTPVIEACLSE